MDFEDALGTASALDATHASNVLDASAASELKVNSDPIPGIVRNSSVQTLVAASVARWTFEKAFIPLPVTRFIVRRPAAGSTTSVAKDRRSLKSVRWSSRSNLARPFREARSIRTCEEFPKACCGEAAELAPADVRF